MTDEQFLALAKDRFQQSIDATNHMRVLALDDLRFATGDQWPDAIRRQRDQDGRPCLTINKLPAFIKQVVNDQRQNRPAIKISPVDSNGDPETAEVIAGLCRHIEASSDADVAYDTAFESAVRCGFGYLRVLTEYVSPDSFDKEIVIKRIRNGFAVYFDPTAEAADYSDAKWCFIVQDLTQEQYKAAYPDTSVAAGAGLEGIGNNSPGWITPTNVRVAEYFYTEETPVTLCLVNTTQGEMAIPKSEVPPGLPILEERVSKRPQIMWAKLNGCEVLKRGKWPGRFIPIVPVLGDEAEVDGQIILGSLVRNAKDSQRMYNYWASAETEAIALAPKAPFLVAEGQIEGYERQWESANVKNNPVLTYKPTSIGGHVIGAPQRQTAEPAIQAISHARLMSSDDIKATTGIFDASLGNRSNESSGRAIVARQREGDTATYHFQDNLSRAIRHCGRILLDLIPKIYNRERVVRILGLDGEPESVLVNAPTRRKGAEAIYDLTAGKYDVVVSTGPSYTTKRQAGTDAMLELAKAYPPIMQIAGDLLVKSMDWPGAEALAERLQMALPPELKPKDENGPQIPPQVQQAVAAMQQQIASDEQLIEHLKKALDDEQVKAANEAQMKAADIASKEKIAELQEETKRIIAFANLDQVEGIAVLRNELDAIKVDIANAHQMRMQEFQAESQFGQNDQKVLGQLALAQQAADNQRSQTELEQSFAPAEGE